MAGCTRSGGKGGSPTESEAAALGAGSVLAAGEIGDCAPGLAAAPAPGPDGAGAQAVSHPRQPRAEAKRHERCNTDIVPLRGVLSLAPRLAALLTAAARAVQLARSWLCAGDNVSNELPGDHQGLAQPWQA